MADDVVELSAEVVDRPGRQDRLLVLIHGYGEAPDVLAAHLGVLDPDGDLLAVTPEGPFEKAGRPLWHRALTGDAELAREQYATSVRSLDRLLDRLEVETGLPRADAVVGGFSQGGGIALGLLGLPGTVPPAAVFGLCTFVPWIAGLDRDPSRFVGRPVLLTAATEDRFAPIEVARDGAAALVDDGCRLTYHEVPGDHVVSDAAVAHLADWLAALTADGSPADR